MLRATSWTLLALIVTSCSEGDPAAMDGELDDFMVDGKSDTGGISDGSAEAWGVLALANEADLALLRDGVGLALPAAQNIVAFKAGDDEVAGTDDDARFGSLAQLDAVPYVGPVAFGRLLAYAQANGYLDEPPPPVSDDPFDPNACPGPSLTLAEALDRAASDPVLGAYQFAIRRRSCHDLQTGHCDETWQDVPPETLPWATHASGIARLVGLTNGNVAVNLDAGRCDDPTGWNLQRMIGAQCTGVGNTLTCGTYRYPCSPYTKNFSFDPYSEDYVARLSGRVTASCLYLRAETRSIFADGPNHEAVILVRY